MSIRCWSVQGFWIAQPLTCPAAVKSDGMIHPSTCYFRITLSSHPSDFFSYCMIRRINGISRYSRDNVLFMNDQKTIDQFAWWLNLTECYPTNFCISLVNKLVIDRLDDIVSPWNFRRRLLFDSSFNRVRHRVFRFLFSRLYRFDCVRFEISVL